VSSFQPNSLLDGYSIRLATEQDSERILNFSYSQPNNLLGFLVVVLSAIWCLINISVDKLRTICLLSAGSLLILILLSWHVTEVRNSLEGKLRITHLVEYENIICGVVTYLVFDRFVYIGGVLIDINHRRKGLGSFMIQHCIDTIEIPIYLQCRHELKAFYERLGFVHVSLFHAPSELSRLRSPNLHLMVLNETH
jgi:N-acetylglutamate synthase-like GNAT family acetyltransferase